MCRDLSQYFFEIRIVLSGRGKYRTQSQRVYLDVGSNLAGGDFRYSRFTNAKMGGAILTGARLLGADMSETDLIGANLDSIKGYQLNLNSSVLTSASLRHADLESAKMTDRYSIHRYRPSDGNGNQTIIQAAGVQLRAPKDVIQKHTSAEVIRSSGRRAENRERRGRTSLIRIPFGDPSVSSEDMSERVVNAFNRAIKLCQLRKPPNREPF